MTQERPHRKPGQEPEPVPPWVDRAMRKAFDYMEETGSEHKPYLMLYTDKDKQNETPVVCVLPTGDGEKITWTGIATMLVSEHRPTDAIFLMSAWASVGTLEPGELPEDDPHHIHVCSFSWMRPNKPAMTWLAEYDLTSKGKVVDLKPFKYTLDSIMLRLEPMWAGLNLPPPRVMRQHMPKPRGAPGGQRDSVLLWVECPCGWKSTRREVGLRAMERISEDRLTILDFFGEEIQSHLAAFIPAAPPAGGAAPPTSHDEKGEKSR